MDGWIQSPILMAFPDADIQVITDKGLEKTTYEDTEHYQVTRQFLNNPGGMLKQLLNRDGDDMNDGDGGRGEPDSLD